MRRFGAAEVPPYPLETRPTTVGADDIDPPPTYTSRPPRPGPRNRTVLGHFRRAAKLSREREDGPKGDNGSERRHLRLEQSTPESQPRLRIMNEGLRRSQRPSCSSCDDSGK